MSIQQGESYRCSSCNAEVQVTKSSSEGAEFGGSEFGAAEFGGGATAPLTCCGKEMEKIQ